MILRESYAAFKGMGLAEPKLGTLADSTSFSEFVASATSDTGAWNEAVSAWKLERSLLSRSLGELGYGTGPFTWRYGEREKVALSKFQRDLGLPVTGVLDSASAAHLYGAFNALKKTDVVLARLSVSNLGSTATATGTWKAITDTLGFPVNTVHIFCDRATRECVVEEVDFISEDLAQVSWEDRAVLSISQWDRDLLVAHLGTSGSGATMTINFPASEVIWSQVQPARETPLGNLHASQMTLRLVDGMYLSPPQNGGDLKEVHDLLFAEKLKYEALRDRNTESK